MPLFSRETVRSPAFIFIVYVVLASLFVMIFRILFPGEAPPLPIFADSWRMAMWVQDMIALFPALTMAALVLPFCMTGFQGDGHHAQFSPDLFKRRFMVPTLTAISASVFYGLLFFVFLPMAQGSERNMRFEGEIYRMARDRARVHVEAGEWVNASQFLGMAKGIWPGSRELVPLWNEVETNLERMRFASVEGRGQLRPYASRDDIHGLWHPGVANTAQAMAMSRAAYRDGLLFDAHWLATLGWRLAPGNSSPEAIEAARFAAHTWNRIEEQRPTAGEMRQRELFLRKRAGYLAMQSGDWIQAFYIFQALAALTPGDPDVRNFLEHSRRELDGVAFFTDTMNLTIGNTTAGVVFSLPVELGNRRGRAVLRLASLSSTPDVAYGVGLEYMLFDYQSRLMLHLHAPYARFRPLVMDMDGPNPRPMVDVLMRAVNRNDPGGIWEPTVEWSAGAALFDPGHARFSLNISYDTFLMLSQMRQDVSAMHIGRLSNAARVSRETGYISQVFQAEILNRLGAGLFLLPAAIAAIAIGWYLRTKRFPRYLFIPLLFVLPVVFNGIAYIIRAGLNIIGISLTLGLGFPVALTLFSIILAGAFVCSLFLLAAQKS